MDDSVAQFVAVTNASLQEAQTFIEQAGGDLDQAVSLFFASQDDDDEAPVAPDTATVEPDAPASRPAAPAPPASSSQRRPAPPSTSSRFGTLGDLAAKEADDDEDDEDPRRTLFAGGGKSGLSVQDPSKGKVGDDVKRDLLQKAQEGSLKRQQAVASRSAAAPPSSFRGSGNTLGSDDVESRHVPDQQGDRQPRSRMPGGLVEGGDLSGDEDAANDDDDEEATVTRTLTFWRNGFSIDDGELMSYQEHREVLEELRDGRAPLSLLGIRLGQRVDMRIANRESEEYTQPPKVHKPFEGAGNRLGAPSPIPSATRPTATTRSPVAAASPAGSTKFHVDPNQPTTQLQIRLSDGSRIVARFNHEHTIADIRNYIVASHAGLASEPYVLQTTFPTRDLTESTQTIKDANLLGSVIVMRPH